MACTSGEPKAATATATTTISAVHSDIIQTHILTRLDGPALASIASTCSQLHALSSNEHLWAKACNSTWPSTSAPRVQHIISTFPNGSRSFFADCFAAPTATTAPTNPDRTPELISAVDLFYGQRLVLSRVVETETVTGWFRCSPFRVDLLDPKDVVRTRVKYPEEVRLRWIVIDPASGRAVDVSSGNAVAVERHWLSGEVKVRFATVVGGGEKVTAAEVVLCSVVVTWGGRENENENEMMEVREVSLRVEDMDGKQFNGRDSLVILQRALEGGRNGNCKGKEYCYGEFVKRKKEWEEEKVRAEGKLDMLCLCVGFAGIAFAGLFVLWRWW